MIWLGHKFVDSGPQKKRKYTNQKMLEQALKFDLLICISRYYVMNINFLNKALESSWNLLVIFLHYFVCVTQILLSKSGCGISPHHHPLIYLTGNRVVISFRDFDSVKPVFILSQFTGTQDLQTTV